MLNDSLLPVYFEIEAQMPQWLSQHSVFTKNERDEQAAQGSVAVEKGMDCFKLDMRHLLPLLIRGKVPHPIYGYQSFTMA